MNVDKILSYIGLAAKAGKLASGEFLTEKSVKEGKAKLVIVAEDASDNTKKLFINKCDYYHVRMEVLSNKEQLGHAMGKQFRASLAILDQGFSDAIVKHI